MPDRTTSELMIELEKLQQRNAELEALMIEHEKIEGELRRYKNQLEELVNQRTAALTEANAKLSHSEAQSRALLNAIPDMMFRVNKNGTFMAYNPEPDDQFGTTDPNQIIGENVRDKMPLDVAKTIIEGIDKTLETGEMQTGEYKLTIGDEEDYFEYRMVMVDATEVLVIVRNITDHTVADLELQQYRKYLEEMLSDRTHRLELIAQLSGKLNAMLDINRLLADLVNQLQDSFDYYHAHVYLYDEETQELVLKAASGEAGEKLRQQQHRLRLGEGIVGQVANNNQPFITNNVDEAISFIRNPLLPDTKSELAVPMHTGSKLIGVVDVQHHQYDGFNPEDVAMVQTIADQTAIAINNTQLLSERQSTLAQLEAVDDAKSQFITMISHELRTPLQAINGFAELLLFGLSGDLSSQAKSDIALIQNNGRHLLALIDDIIDIAQIEAGQIDITVQTLDIQTIVEEVLNDANALLTNKPVVLVPNIPQDLPTIQADQSRLKQILFNLLSNAAKFTKEGQIMLKAKISADYPDCIKFSVIDTGIGIPESKRKEIFKLFQQADMSDARRYSGLGVGLPICKALVQKHGGEIGVISSYNNGSEFWFTIPMTAM